MSLHAMTISGYRSLRDVRMSFSQLNIVLGANGSGKSNLYQSLRLLQAAADGRFAREVALEGGIDSLMWAGRRKKGEAVRLTLGVTVDDLSYEFCCGLPEGWAKTANGATPPEYYDENCSLPRNRATLFRLDPTIKSEHIWPADATKRSALVDRKNQIAHLRDIDGKRLDYPQALGSHETILSTLRDVQHYPWIDAYRRALAGWRFYHGFRTDRDAALRHPQVATRTPVLAHHGEDLASALQTIIENGDALMLRDAVAQAFGGARLEVELSEGRLTLTLVDLPTLARPLRASEFSDSQLRFLCLLAALLSPEPSGLLVLNEPESSLHTNLLEPLARLIVHASQHSQLWVATHSRLLVEHIDAYGGDAKVMELENLDGETKVVGQGLLGF